MVLDRQSSELWCNGKLGRLGELLFCVLRATHPKVSRLNSVLLDIQNKVMEVFMVLPANVLTGFIEVGRHREARRNTNISDEGRGKRDSSDPFAIPILTVLLQHLRTMLLVTRVEKTR